MPTLSKPLRSLSMGVLFVAVTGCASTPDVPESEFAVVRASIDQAVQVRATSVAGSDMLSAERKLEAARRAADNDEPVRAQRLLAEARLHAELAEVSVATAEARNNLKEVRANLDLLREELNRPSS